MYFRKLKTTTAKKVAKLCGVEQEFEVLGDVLHEDDLKEVMSGLLDLPEHTMMMLYEPDPTIGAKMLEKKS